MNRKVLGRGLSALLHEVEASPTPGVREVALDLIDPNPFQPRRAFSDEALTNLADSIRSTGIVQPVLLRHGVQPERYQIVAGERRWRAARMAGITVVPAIIRDLSDRDALELALTENLLREDLNALEVAKAYEALQDQFQLSHEDIAARLGVNRSTVTNTLRLLKLPPSVQELLQSGSISAGHARALLAFESPDQQSRVAALIASEGLSVRQTERMVALGGAKPVQPDKSPRPEPTQDANTRAAVLEMERALGTKVKITGTGERGRIEINYFSAEDLERIYNILITTYGNRPTLQADGS
jgi:ParB family chromosome partitioning protein